MGERLPFLIYCGGGGVRRELLLRTPGHVDRDVEKTAAPTRNESEARIWERSSAVLLKMNRKMLPGWEEWLMRAAGWRGIRQGGFWAPEIDIMKRQRQEGPKQRGAGGEDRAEDGCTGAPGGRGLQQRPGWAGSGGPQRLPQGSPWR